MGASGEHPTTFLTPRAASTLGGQTRAGVTSQMKAKVTSKNQPPPRYPVSVEFEGKTYAWDVPFTVRMGMGPVDLTQRNAKVGPVPR